MNNVGIEKNDVENVSSTQDSNEEAIVDFRLDEDLKKIKTKYLEMTEKFLKKKRLFEFKT